MALCLGTGGLFEPAPSLLKNYYCTSWYWGHCPQCIHVEKPSKTNKYNIIRNKCPGIYFLWALQDPALISYNLFWRYDDPTTFSNCSAPTWSLGTCPRRPLTTAVMVFICPSENTSWEAVEKQSLDKCQQESTWQTDCSTNGRLIAQHKVCS